MRCLVTLFLFLSLTLMQGCGTVFIGGALNRSSATGTVSIVRLTAGNGGQITFVTLLDSGSSQDLNFCGNVVDRFPIGSTVRVSFTPGTSCNSFIAISIVF